MGNHQEWCYWRLSWNEKVYWFGNSLHYRNQYGRWTVCYFIHWHQSFRTFQISQNHHLWSSKSRKQTLGCSFWRNYRKKSQKILHQRWWNRCSSKMFDSSLYLQTNWYWNHLLSWSRTLCARRRNSRINFVGKHD